MTETRFFFNKSVQGVFSGFIQRHPRKQSQIMGAEGPFKCIGSENFKHVLSSLCDIGLSAETRLRVRAHCPQKNTLLARVLLVVDAPRLEARHLGKVRSRLFDRLASSCDALSSIRLAAVTWRAAGPALS